MAWLEVRLDTTSEAIDWVRTLLVGAIDPQDLHVTNYLDSGLKDSEDLEPAIWEFTILLYFPEDGRSRTKLDSLEQTLAPLCRTGLTTEMQVAIVEEKLLVPNNLWQPVGEKFVILSADSDLGGEKTRIPLIIKPSLAFGSGLHPATMLSLQMLERHVLPGMHTLDLGSGSGILTVAMAKLGATVLALDNDPIAVLATQEAIDLNQVSTQAIAQAGSLGGGNNLGHWLGGDIADCSNRSFDQVPTVNNQANTQVAPQGKFDLVMANIFARIHIALATDFYQALQQDDPRQNSYNKNRGILITTGFTKDQEEDVIIACQKTGFELIDRLYQDQWVALVLQTHSKLQSTKLQS